MIVAGIFAFLVAPFVTRLIRLFPPIVTGSVITIIGIVLLSVAALDAGGGGASQLTDPPTFGAPRNLRADVVGVTTPFHLGAPTFPVAAVISMVIVMLITMAETTGDVFACGEIVGKPIDKEDVARALRADGLPTTLGGILNSFPYTCFAENVGLVRLTKVRSRWVVATAGLFEAPAERQLELIQQYPDLAVRENTKETILRSGNARLQSSPAAEQATALVEIAKIANLRLLDIVEEPVDQPAG